MDVFTLAWAAALLLVGFSFGYQRRDKWASKEMIQDLAGVLCADESVVVEVEDEEHGKRTLRIHYMGGHDEGDDDEEPSEPVDSDELIPSYLRN